MSSKRVAVIVGSLRKDSYNLKLARGIVSLLPSRYSAFFPAIGDVPLFNEDLEANPPAAWTRLRQEVAPANALLIATPEYNRSVTAAGKNALDVLSRPYGKNVLDGKPSAVVSASIGQLGGALANHHVRQSLVFLNSPCLQQPEVYLSNASTIFNADGTIKAESTKQFLANFVKAFVAHVDRYN